MTFNVVFEQVRLVLDGGLSSTVLLYVVLVVQVTIGHVVLASTSYRQCRNALLFVKSTIMPHLFVEGRVTSTFYQEAQRVLNVHSSW